MKEKIKQWSNKPSVILTATVIAGIVGAILGVHAYYGQWLG